MSFDLRALAFFLLLAAPARAQQVTITIGGYGTPPPNNAPPPVATQPTTPPRPYGYGALQGQAAYAQLAMYGQYMQYLSILNYQASHGGELPPTASTKDYFTNGAAVTTVPSSGQPGSAYFTNGSEATVLPVARPAAPPPSPPPPSSGAAPAGGPSPWVVVYENPNPSATAVAPPPVIAAPPPIAEPAADTRQPVVAMSFEDWLQSMGLNTNDTADELTPVLTSAEVATTIEPAALANDVRQRVSYDRPEKARVHLDAAGGGMGTLTGITGAFAAGLILGGLAMLRLRDRARKQSELAPAPSSVPPASSAK